jgi:hypothetical protein
MELVVVISKIGLNTQLLQLFEIILGMISAHRKEEISYRGVNKC